jgi:hypothetical protein
VDGTVLEGRGWRVKFGTNDVSVCRLDWVCALGLGVRSIIVSSAATTAIQQQLLPLLLHRRTSAPL